MLVAVSAVASGCGSGERTFTPEEFVEAIDEQGGQLALGEVLTTRSDGVEVHVLRFSGDPEDTQLHDRGTGDATMIVLEDSGQAKDEFARCEAAPLLTCFRAANVVLRFEDMGAADRARVVGAVEGLDQDGG